MYNLIKKNLLILAILALPVMNTASQAMLEEDPPANTCQKTLPQEPEDNFVATQSTPSANAPVDVFKIGFDVCIKTPLQFGVGVLQAAVKDPWTTGTFAVFGLMTFASANCPCTCSPDGVFHKDPLYLGDSAGKLTCEVSCAAKGYNLFSCPGGI